MMVPKDLLGHVPAAVSEYERRRADYKKLAEKICDLVTEHSGPELIHKAEWRGKAVHSFEKKIRKLNQDGTARYPKPFTEITDLSGVRIIVFVRASVDTIVDKISEILEVIEVEDVGDRVYDQGKFGYQSKHLLVKLGPDRKNLFENKRISELVCEIQVRTILQHAWAEMEHDIQYKSDAEIPRDLGKRFSALAGLLELADREFQSIQKDSDLLKSAVRLELINDLTQQSMTEKLGLSEKNTASEQSVAARDLIAKRRYAEAIELYSEKIADQPNSYTQHIGRARARFLIGDVRGSIEDLDMADQKSGDIAHTRRLRAIVESGDHTALRPNSSNSGHVAYLKEAGEFLQAGEGIRAFERYSDTDAPGYSKPFAIFGKAMSCAMEKDYPGSRGYLSELEIRPGTPMAVNICALAAVLDCLERVDPQTSLASLEVALESMPDYSFRMSPLRFFVEGLGSKGGDDLQSVAPVIERLKHYEDGEPEPLAED